MQVLKKASDSRMNKVSSQAGARNIIQSTKEVVGSSTLGFPRHIFTVQGLDVLTMEPTLDTTLEAAFWSSRAWTYQGYLLSERRMIFNKTLVYCLCTHDIFS